MATSSRYHILLVLLGLALSAGAWAFQLPWSLSGGRTRLVVMGASPQDEFRSKDRLRVSASATSTANNYESIILPGRSSTKPPSSIAPPSPVTPGDASLLWGRGRSTTGSRVELVPQKGLKEELLKGSYQECERITSAYAKTFYLGTSFLDMDKRSATWAIYVWCRRTDDIVDSPRAILENTMEADLEEWNRRLDDIWAGKPWDALDAALTDVVQRYPTMSIEPYRDMIKGMVMDIPGIGQDRYQNFEELYLYCYRVAGTVGLMTLPVMGTAPGHTLEQAMEPALALGVALQLTNILRDVGEDSLRGRIYLPLEDLERFGVTEDQIMRKIMNSNYRELVKFEIQRAREYFNRAEDGIKMLSPDARLPVRASLDMYRKILDVIEENDYDNFRKRAYVSKLEKLLTLPSSWLKTL